MKLSPKKYLSLWFIPPEGIESKLSELQQQLIEIHMTSSSSSSGLKKKRLPTFTPHVTLIGGIPISECCTVENDVLPLLLLLLQQQQQQKQHITTTITWSDDQADKKKVDHEEEQELQDVLDEVAARSVVMRLANAFCNFGGVECKFVKKQGVFAPRRHEHEEEGDAVTTNNNDLDHNNNSGGDGDGDNSNNNNSNVGSNEKEGEVPQWNQSCISIMERTGSFKNAMVLADQVLFFPTTTTKRITATTNYNEHDHFVYCSESSCFERHLKKPAGEPHYSFIYGNDANLISSLKPPSSSSSSSSSNDVSSGGGGMKKKNDDNLVLKCPPDFTSTEIAVMWTYPSTLEGVEQWREIGRFSLVPSFGRRLELLLQKILWGGAVLWAAGEKSRGAFIIIIFVFFCFCFQPIRVNWKSWSSGGRLDDIVWWKRKECIHRALSWQRK